MRKRKKYSEKATSPNKQKKRKKKKQTSDSFVRLRAIGSHGVFLRIAGGSFRNAPGEFVSDEISNRTPQRLHRVVGVRLLKNEMLASRDTDVSYRLDKQRENHLPQRVKTEQ